MAYGFAYIPATSTGCTTLTPSTPIETAEDRQGFADQILADQIELDGYAGMHVEVELDLCADIWQCGAEHHNECEIARGYEDGVCATCAVIRLAYDAAVERAIAFAKATLPEEDLPF